MLVIAHRLSTIRDADIIAVVAHGKIVEVGNEQKKRKYMQSSYVKGGSNIKYLVFFRNKWY